MAAEIGEEHVAAEALAAWSGLDLREVDLARGEHAQAAHEPPRAVGARAPEDERGLELSLLGEQWRLDRPTGERQPGEAGFVVAAVLDLLAQDRGAVDRGR